MDFQNGAFSIFGGFCKISKKFIIILIHLQNRFKTPYIVITCYLDTKYKIHGYPGQSPKNKIHSRNQVTNTYLWKNRNNERFFSKLELSRDFYSDFGKVPGDLTRKYGAAPDLPKPYVTYFSRRMDSDQCIHKYPRNLIK